MAKKQIKYYAVSFGMAGKPLFFKTIAERTKVIKAVKAGFVGYSTWTTLK